MSYSEHVSGRRVGVFCLRLLGGVGIVCIAVFAAGCGYRYYASPLRPAPDTQQMAGTRVSDDGTVTFAKERLEIAVRPVSDEELNRQFATHSKGGTSSTNPYTYGDWQDPVTGTTPSRFTVFLLKLKNYAYPKVQVDPLKATLIADNGRRYRVVTPLEFDEYYRPYVVGNAGNEYARYQDRQDLFKATRYRGDVIFSGQDAEGFLLFPRLHSDVEGVRLRLAEVVVRFDFRGEPVETLDLEYYFQRDVRKRYPGREVAQVE